MLSFLALVPVAWAVAGVLRLRAEEEAGRSEAMTVTGSSRPGLLGGWLAVVGAASVAMLVVLGLDVGLGMTAATGDAGWIGRLTVASLAYVPATLLVAAVAAALVAAGFAGLRRRDVVAG
jgi:ABC-2 type transport system permease protein